MENRIAQHRFFSLSGEGLEGPKQHLTVLARPGVNGVGVWLDAVRGRPLTVRSAVDCRNLADARLRYNQYTQLIGTDPVEMTWANQRMAAEGWKVVVLDVRLVVCRSLAIAVGGLNKPSLAWLECDWDLVPVAIGQ